MSGVRPIEMIVKGKCKNEMWITSENFIIIGDNMIFIKMANYKLIYLSMLAR